MLKYLYLLSTLERHIFQQTNPLCSFYFLLYEKFYFLRFGTDILFFLKKNLVAAFLQLGRCEGLWKSGLQKLLPSPWRPITFERLPDHLPVSPAVHCTVVILPPDQSPFLACIWNRVLPILDPRQTHVMLWAALGNRLAFWYWSKATWSSLEGSY